MRLLLSSVLLFSCFALFSQDSTINVMSYNIRYPNPGDGIHYWDNRRPLVASMIRFHEADLIGVQEAHRRQLDEMITDMSKFAWVGVCRTDGSMTPNPDNEFSAILYRKDRFELQEGNTFWLSETPDKAGSVSWDAALPRIVTWARFKDKLTGNVFYHFNTHFDHMGSIARNESAKLLRQKITDIAKENAVIVTGDFNCGENDAPYHTLTDKSKGGSLNDAMYISKLPHHGPQASFAGNFTVSGLNDHRIDFIFVKNKVEVIRHAILSDFWNGNFASDHLTVFAECSIF